MSRQHAPRALLVDLNNFARYPTLSIGYLVAALRSAGMAVEVLCPLNHGVHPATREPPETLRVHLQRRAYFATHRAVAPLHEGLRAARQRARHRPDGRIVAEVSEAMQRQRPDVLLLSAYLDHYPSVVALARVARKRGVPVLLGGPMFNNPEIAAEWLDIAGITAIVGAEVDRSLPAIVRDLLAGDDLTRHEGVMLPDGRSGPPAPPLQDLAGLPVPDFDDFPWARYPDRIIPVMAGRGCSWGRCLFCSDVATANGRSFRTRPAAAILDELERQAERYGTRDVIFLDIKLNSDVAMWRGIIDGFQARLPGGRWIGTVHVQARGDHGLSRADLHAARASGLTRISFGLETGSQRVNTAMAKGTTIERTSEFLHDAHDAGLSVRASMMVGYPGETAADLRQTNAFLDAHERHLDRIRFSRFKAIPGTRFAQRRDERPERYPELRHFRWNPRLARAGYRNALSADPDYRREKRALLRRVHRINQSPLRDDAVVFDGLM